MKDLKIPLSLQKLQTSMGSSVSMPFAWDTENPEDFIIQIEKYPKELLESISEQGQISAEDRLGIYNRGYWFRLFTVLQGEFPTLIKLINYNDFNRLAQEYLQVFPSHNQILNYLADYFMEFMNLDHSWNNKNLKKAAELDYCYIKAFDAPQRPPLDPTSLSPEELESLTEKVFYLQEHAYLFQEERSFTALRAIKLEDDELPLELPKKQPGQWLIFRNLLSVLECILLNDTQCKILQAIQSGLPFSQALEKAFSELSEEETEKLGPDIGIWFNQWVSWGIFTLEK
jgi:hypothetical protein